MKKAVLHFLGALMVLVASQSCSQQEVLKPISETSVLNDEISGDDSPKEDEDYHYLALGDSYTIGTGVTQKESFPFQLKQILDVQLNTDINLEIIAGQGWRSDILIDELSEVNRDNYSFVTLLIGVNNQFQNVPFSTFEDEFISLLDQSIAYTRNRPERVVVISIPDYTYSPQGENYSRNGATSDEIDDYNAFIQNTAEERNTHFVNVTDISRNGLEDPDLIAPDGLHLSAQGYAQIIYRILPIVSKELSK